MAFFFVISAALSDKLVAASNELHVYTSLVTLQGEKVCSRETVRDFPDELFTGHTLRAVERGLADFPPPPDNPLLPNRPPQQPLP